MYHQTAYHNINWLIFPYPVSKCLWPIMRNSFHRVVLNVWQQAMFSIQQYRLPTWQSYQGWGRGVDSTVSHAHYDYKGMVYVLAVRYQGCRFSMHSMRYCVERCRKPQWVSYIYITPDLDSNFLHPHLKVPSTASHLPNTIRPQINSPIVCDFTWNTLFSITHNVLI